MKRSLLLLIVLIVLGLLAWKLSSDREGSTVKKELIDFAVSDTSQVTRVYIAKSDGSTVDLNRNGDHWTVNNEHQAKKVNVDLLLKCFNRIEIRGPVPSATRETVIKNMSSQATKVEIYLDGDKPVKTWYLGSATQDHFGTYMLLETEAGGRSTVPFEMGMSGFTGFLTARFHTILEDWRDSKLIAVKDLKSIATYSVKNGFLPAESFSISTRGQELGLFDAKGEVIAEPDTARLVETLITLQKLHYEFFEDFFNEAQRDSVLKSEPMFEVHISFNDGSEQHVDFWKRKPPTATYADDGTELPTDPDRMFSSVNDSELVVVQRHLFDRALPRLSDLH